LLLQQLQQQGEYQQHLVSIKLNITVTTTRITTTTTNNNKLQFDPYFHCQNKQQQLHALRHICIAVTLSERVLNPIETNITIKQKLVDVGKLKNQNK